MLKYIAESSELFGGAIEFLKRTSNRPIKTFEGWAYYSHTSSQGYFARVNPNTRQIEMATEELEIGLGIVDLKEVMESILNKGSWREHD